MVAPHELLEKYQKYEYILNVKRERLLKSLFERVPEEGGEATKADFDEIAAKIY